jgi:hypothetical protein
MYKKLLPCAAVLVLLCAACENAAAPVPSGSAADLSEVAAALAALPLNTADDPHPLVLEGFDFSDPMVWTLLLQTLEEGGKYAALDLSACGGDVFAAAPSSGSGTGKEYVVSLVFPEGAASFGGANFDGYPRLRSVRFPDSAAALGGSFKNCPELETVSFPASVGDLGGDFSGSPRVSFEVRGAGMFSSPAYPAVGIPAGKLLVRNGATLVRAAPSLGGNITLPASITLGERCFSQNVAITGLTVPDGISAIPARAFQGCGNLASVTLPASVTAIGEFAFAQCPLLASVALPPSAVVGERAFGDSGLTAITVPPGARLSFEVFMNCVKLREEDIQTVQFGYGLFTYCLELEHVTLPASLREIPRNTFAGCVNLSTVNAESPGTVNLPVSLERMGESAFGGCAKITTVDMSGLTELDTIYLYAFSDCALLAHVTLPPGLAEIHNSAFRQCVGLAALDIPAAVTRLGNAAFMRCSTLRNVTIRAVQPPSIMIDPHNSQYNNTFYGNYQPLTFHVPAASVSAYQTAWSGLGAAFTAFVE